MPLTDEIYIYCDGACSGNPGPGGWGSIVILNQKVIELGDSANATTNNRMEMTAVLVALNYCLQQKNISEIKKIHIFTDSVYVIRGFTQWMHGWKRRGWKTADNGEVSNQDLWQNLDLFSNQIKKINPNLKIEWSFVKGHSGVPGNERCDEIAVAFSKKNHVDLYQGLAKYYIFDPYQLPETRPLPDLKNKSTATPKTVWYISYVNGKFSRHETWKECEALVKGRAAQFKKVTSAEEEEQIKKTWGV